MSSNKKIVIPAKARMMFFLSIVATVASFSAQAKTDPYGPFKDQFNTRYPACYEAPKSLSNTESQGLDQPEPIDLAHCPTYGVLLQGPTRGFHPFYSFRDYHQRLFYPTTVLYPQGAKASREAPDHWIKPGTVLALYKWSLDSTTIHMFWLTADKWVPSEQSKRDPVEIGMELIFKLPKGWRYTTHGTEIMTWLESWVKPFSALSDARQYAQTVDGVPKAMDTSSIHPVGPGVPRPSGDASATEPYRSPAIRPVGPGVPRNIGNVSPTTVVKEGMSIQEIEALYGVPTEKAVMKDETIYAYPDKVVTFKDGKLKKVEFR